MSNLIKFQQAYSAAAKLITTANQMFDTLLAMKN
jgi:flagellar hook-associated protein 1 FlgK